MKKILTSIVFATMLMACNTDNPLLSNEETPYGVPAFDKIENKHYLPAFEEAIKQAQAEIDAIVNNKETATFENTIVALDHSGNLLNRISGAFFNVLEADGNEEMDAIAATVTPMVTEFSDNIVLNDNLFKRVKDVYEQREELDLTPEQMRLLTETYKHFVQSGANLTAEQKERLRQINQELGLLSLQFGNNVVAETNAYQLFITDEEKLEGLPESAKTAAKEEAIAAGREDAWLFTPKRTSFTPVLQYCKNRELRKELLLAYTTRANHDNANDNKDIINKTMRLRVEKAQLFGYSNPADYILSDCMAHDAQTVNAFLQSVWEPSLKQAKNEASALQAMLEKDLPGEKLQPWDWWYYAEQLRSEKYNLNEEELKPYFQLENVRKGAFQLAGRLYGLQFEQLKDMPVYNADVEVFKVTDEDNQLIGILYCDYFPRAGKRPGAWMNNICNQYIDAEGKDHRPVIINVGNFNKPTAGQPSLLSMDDVETLFHEFGHALHGLLSKATYQTLAGTNVPRDFVELPSQFMENYCYEPEIMRTYAFHYETGEVIPDSLIQKINNAGKFNQGFVETELLSASILDMDYHCITDTNYFDVNEFEAKSMERMGMIPEIIVRYRSTFYNHIFTTGYEAGYYSYTWSAVLDADAFQAFKETGDICNPEVASKFRHLLEQGGTRDAQELYLEFRGKAADPKYLLLRKGFTEE
ncbi:MAG: M3 family metallopeptidase [Paludibacter sp.]|nr:M3 family metallopeptidase [Bacteroidales bacterium]MCM1068527.1 M3 family metallopeptidase [Prevotella sp.]MCM1353481.1 M3 family metallopeptidase [Bacteroides sp.]MCM1442642.1 M3 family metallopeptidase [Muribaculum sp.]MCM1481487.1 M3 family metallopeptidase [Paludibacter sp.]